MKVASLPYYIYKSSMPNICQTDRRSRVLSNHGNTWCGPAAVSNALIYLAKSHFQMIVPPQGELTEPQAQAKLIQLLSRLMRTHDERGTTPLNAMSGLEKYIRDRGYGVSIQWQGRFNGGDYACGIIPCPEWIMKGAVGTSNAILNIGEYEFLSQRLLYKRIEGHYLTVSGFNSKRNELIVNDPALGNKTGPISSPLSKIIYGSLSRWNKIASCAAKEFHKLLGVHLPYPAMNTAIIDGAFVFNVFRK